ncbi:MAG: hydroxyacid dehydrogenase [Saprospiraceae bacterium]|nr:hydroxyacid dehydrogenase [Saprospiraceae bacterium]
MRPKILITDKVHPLLPKGLEDLGFDVQYDTSVEMDVLPAILDQYTGIVINSKIRMTPEMIDRGPSLQFIGRLGSGMEIIDVPYATSKGIACLNSPEGNRDAVAEHAIGMLLAFNNHLLRADEEVKKKEWNREANRGTEIKGKTLGIIGLGNTGSCVAKKMSSWELNIISYDKYRPNSDQELPFVQRVNLEDILNQADIITLHLPLTAETRHLVNRSFFQKCKKSPVLINTSRGEVVNTYDLLEALENNWIKGACLDVFENEKPGYYSRSEEELYCRLFEHKNLIVSPHIAGWTHESLEKIASVLLEKIKNVVC